MSREQYESWTRVLALVLQIVGILGVIFVFVFGAVTGNFQLGLLPFAGGFAGGGLLIDGLKEKKPIKGADRDEAPDAP